MKKFYQDSSDTSRYWLQKGDVSSPFYTGDLRPIFMDDQVALIDKRTGRIELSYTDIVELGNDSDSDESYWSDLPTFKEDTADFFVNASSDGGTGDILTQSGSNIMAIGVLVKARSVTITAGTWIVTGNIFCDGDALSSGYAKAALNLANNTFTTNETTQVDIDSNENDFGFSVMPLPLTVTEDTTVFLNFAREIGTTAVTLYSKIQAVKVG